MVRRIVGRDAFVKVKIKRQEYCELEPGMLLYVKSSQERERMRGEGLRSKKASVANGDVLHGASREERRHSARVGAVAKMPRSVL